MEHVSGCQDGLSLRIVFNVLSKNKTVASQNFFCLRTPYDKLIIGIRAYIKFVKVAVFSRTSPCRAKSYLAQTTYLPQNIGRILIRNDINLVITFIGGSEALIGRQFLFKQVAAYGRYDLLHII